MIKIAFIGAGSVGFTRRLLMDILTPDQVWAMCDDLFAAEAEWLPQFR